MVRVAARAESWAAATAGVGSSTTGAAAAASGPLTAPSSSTEATSRRATACTPPEKGTCPGTLRPRMAETVSTRVQKVNCIQASQITQVRTPRRASTEIAWVRVSSPSSVGMGGRLTVASSRTGRPMMTSMRRRAARSDFHTGGRVLRAGERKRSGPAAWAR